jgi:hypothetical protein
VRFEKDSGIRIILGDIDRGPDLFIERRPTCWDLELRPDQGDPIGVIRYFDDGKVDFEPERSGTKPVELRKTGVLV